MKQVGGGVGGFRWWVREVVGGGLGWGRWLVGGGGGGSSSHQLIPKGSDGWRPGKCFYGEDSCKRGDITTSISTFNNLSNYPADYLSPK